MKAIYIQDELHRALKLRATRQGVPLKRLVEEAIRLSLQDPGEATTAEVAAASAGGGAFDFLDGDEQDLYLPTDGKPWR